MREVAGGLKHFVGAVLGGTGYVRDRAQEFARRNGRGEDVVRELREASEVVSATLPRVSEATLEAPLPPPLRAAP